MKTKLWAWGCSLLLTLFFSAANARSEIVLERYPTDNGSSFLLVSGQFGPDDPTPRFLAEVAASRPDFVTFSSPGGNLYAAMKLGRAIRQAGLNTLQIRQTECSSACALAFLGGVTRYAMPGSLGVHRSSFSEGYQIEADEAAAQVQAVIADVLSYLGEMGVDSGLLEIALRYDQTDMRYLSGSEMAALRVTTGVDATTQQSASIEPIAPVDIRRAEATALAFVHSVVEAHMSSPEAALRSVRRDYASLVDYFGKTATLQHVLADKRKYFERWPERVYRIREDSLNVICSTASCRVSGLYDWFVRSYPRNRQASGTANFSFVVDVTQSPRVVSEMSEVVSR